MHMYPLSAHFTIKIYSKKNMGNRKPYMTRDQYLNEVFETL